MTDITERLALQPEDIGGPSRMDMLRERIEAKAEIDSLRTALWQCFTDAGGDTDGKTDAAGISTDDLISTTTDCVKDLRLGYDEMLDESSEADRLRARVAELETVEAAARVYYEHYMQDEASDADYCICGLDQHERAKAVRDSLRKAKDGAPEHPAYTAPPAQAVDVDAISDDRINTGVAAFGRENAISGNGESNRCMRAALRAIFNKGE